MIETHDLTKKYGELYAINKIELKLDRGDVFGFIGPNGAGKTTTMRILATLLNPNKATSPTTAMTIRPALVTFWSMPSPPSERPAVTSRKPR